MVSKASISNVENVDRRKRWADRRTGSDRRNENRLKIQLHDCRSDTPRRVGDFSGELTEGTIWWRADKSGVKKSGVKK